MSDKSLSHATNGTGSSTGYYKITLNQAKTINYLYSNPPPPAINTISKGDMLSIISERTPVT